MLVWLALFSLSASAQPDAALPSAPASAPVRAVETADGARFVVSTVDGSEIECAAVRVDAAGRVTLDSGGQGAPQTLEDLSSIVPQVASGRMPIVTPAGAHQFTLADGGRLMGRIISAGSQPRALMVETGALDRIELSFDALAAIRFAAVPDAAAERDMQARMAAPNRPRDELLMLGPSGPVAVGGALEALDDKVWEFRYGQRVRREPLDRAYAVILGGRAWQVPPAAARIAFVDGSSFSGLIRSIGPTDVEIDPSFGGRRAMPWDRIARIDLRSGRVVALASLTLAREESRGFFGYAWPRHVDRAFDGGRLHIGRRQFARGLAVHSFSRLQYELSEPFQSFAANIGLEDESGAGNAVFVVRGDDKPLFDSGPVRAGDAPRAILVPLIGVRVLTLEVQYGEGLDVGDRAVWADARLIR